MKLKNKTYNVTVAGLSFLVVGTTAAGAKRDIVKLLKEEATVEIATGEQLYTAGKKGTKIIGGESEQAELDGVGGAQSDLVDAAAAELQGS